jgi:DNA mismatch repair protein MutL
MNIIRILPEKLVSKIAAGEVIERPASVVRELMDNSVDATATKILVSVEKGGKGLIKVVDDGVGMSKDDLLLCLERHGTSKIYSESDLLSIKTLGFRGEALPSISAVSRLEITTRPQKQLVGYRLRASGGRLKSIDETGAPAGTIVEVRDLFFNLPARRKFLSSHKTELAHITEVFVRITLPFTHIHFQLIENERHIMNLPPSKNMVNRLSAVLGYKVASSLIEANTGTKAFKMTAYLAPPELSRSRGDRILLYVNGRCIRDRLLTHAVMQGYRKTLMKGRYPQCVVFIDMNPSLVDVNVHPTKQEVRFQQSRLVYQTLLSSVEKVLADRSHTLFQGEYYPSEPAKDYQEMKTMATAEQAPEYLAEASSQRTVTPREQADLPQLLKSRPQVIGQLKGTYILCESKDGLLMVDQHAAHERILYETFRKSCSSSRIERQGFLIPPRLELSTKDARVVMDNLNQLRGFGLEIEPFGGNTFLLRTVPSVLVGADWGPFLLDLIPVIEESGKLRGEEALDGFLTTISCHGAIKAGKRLSQEEMTSLMEQLEALDLPAHCPHGRPIFVKFSYLEMDKMFKRVI